MLAPASHASAHDQQFWSALAEGRLLLQRGRVSRTFQYWPRAHSLVTGRAEEMEWVESEGRGVLHSFSTVHRSFYDNLPAPYVLAIVDLDEGVRLLSHLVGCGENEIHIGQRVRFAKTASSEAHRIIFGRDLRPTTKP